jgi:hypothetical protein
MIWFTSITVPHYILKPLGSTSDLREGEDFPRESEPENLPIANLPIANLLAVNPPTPNPAPANPAPGNPPPATHLPPQHEKKILQDACISICMTGDIRGDFWTSSILGSINSRHAERNDQIRKVLAIYKYDRYRARNLTFILHLSDLCHDISKRYEDILDALKSIIDPEVGSLILEIMRQGADKCVI